jgi:hypothetical protein
MIWLTEVRANPLEQTTQALADAYLGQVPYHFSFIAAQSDFENFTRVRTLAVVRGWKPENR